MQIVWIAKEKLDDMAVSRTNSSVLWGVKAAYLRCSSKSDVSLQPGRFYVRAGSRVRKTCQSPSGTRWTRFRSSHEAAHTGNRLAVDISCDVQRRLAALRRACEERLESWVDKREHAKGVVHILAFDVVVRLAVDVDQLAVPST